MKARGDVSFARLAPACGYYDQPHLNREFREFAGTSPGDFVRRLRPEGDVVPQRGDG